MTPIDAAAPARPAPRFAEFVAMMALLMALTALSIDVMLPALPMIRDEFGLTDPNRMQLVVTSYVVGFAVGQLAHGPLVGLARAQAGAARRARGLRPRLGRLPARRQLRAPAGRPRAAGRRQRRAAGDRDRGGARRLRRAADGRGHVLRHGGLHHRAGAGAEHRRRLPAGRQLAPDLRLPRRHLDRRARLARHPAAGDPRRRARSGRCRSAGWRAPTRRRRPTG